MSQMKRLLLSAIMVLVGAVAIPAVASASTLWVSNATPSAPYNSCAHPGYNSIQTALGGPGTSIHVCGGTYEEQVQVERAVSITGYEGATLKVPATTVNATTPCDVASETGSGRPDQDGISVCGNVKVTIKNLTVDAAFENIAGCGYNLYGIVAAGGANLTLSGTAVKGAIGPAGGLRGCQYGVGIQIGTYYDPPATAKLTKDTVSEYQKNGITIEGEGTTATVTKPTVTGAGPLEAIAQNGIGVEYGATGKIVGGTVSGNECNNSSCGPDALTQSQSDGIYFYEAAAGSSAKQVTLSENDVGVESFNPSSSPTETVGNKVTASRYESVLVSEGPAIVNSNKLAGANVGIEALQYEGQKEGVNVSATHDTVSGTTEWAVLGRSDQAAGDTPGEVTITSSKISGNPGARPQESVHTENPEKLPIYAEKDT